MCLELTVDRAGNLGFDLVLVNVKGNAWSLKRRCDQLC